ncbi:hypothetical protein Tco_0603759 [Tanacetum coccineum]
MDDPNITIEEYIKLKEEKARRNGKVYNWETATYSRIWDDDEVHNLKSVETEFPAIVFDDMFTSQAALSCEPTVSPLNDNEIDFRISFDESDDEYYTVIFDKNAFSYKIISIDNLKTDSKNDNDKVNMLLFPSPEPTVSYFDDLDYLKDFENEFPTIVYNDALTSKSDFLSEPTVCPQNVDKFNFKDETSLSECDEEEQNVLYFNDLFSFNIIYLDGLKSNEDNDDMALLPRDQRHQYRRFEGLEYTDADITDFEERLSRIYSRGIHRMLVLDFESLPAMMSERFCEAIVDIDAEAEEMETAGFGLYWAESARYISDKGDLSAYWRRISYKGNFLGTPPSYTHIRDPILRLCHRLIACSIVGRSQAPEKGLTVIVRDLHMIDMAKLVRLQICKELDNTWASVSPGPERQQVAMAGAPEVTEDAHVVDEGALAIPAPVQAPLPPPSDGPARTMA